MKKYFWGVMLCMLVAGVGLYILTSQIASLEVSAQSVMEKCQSASHRPTCYEKEIPKLMNRISMEDAFEVTKLVQNKDPQFAYCHVVAHKLTSRETQKDPTRWKDVLLRCPMATCNYGCLHGSLIERFRGETLTDQQIEETLPDIMDLCEPRTGFEPTGIEQTMCYHGMGHLAMYMTGGEPQKAIPICERVARRNDGRDYAKTCIDGIFMTVFQSIDPEDLALVSDIKPKKEDVSAFCSGYGSYWIHCRRESFALFVEDFVRPQGLVNFCSYALEEESMKDCYWAVVNVVTDRAFEQPDGIERIRTYCQGLPGDTRFLCFGGSAMRLVQVDAVRNVRAADSVCQLPLTDKEKSACYNDLLYYATFSFPVQSEQFISYCQSLSDPWRKQCLSQ